MPYTSIWRNTIPSRSDKDAAVHIRRVRQDIQDRFNGMLGGSGWETDPISGQKYIYFHMSAFEIAYVASGGLAITDFNVSSGGLRQSNTGTHTVRCPLRLPRGATIDDIVLTCSTGTTGTIPWAIRRLEANAATETTIDSGTVASNTSLGNVTLSTTDGAIDDTASNMYYYYVNMQLANGGSANDVVLYGLRVNLKFSGPMPTTLT